MSFPGTWNSSYREHGFLVGGLIVWLIWRDRRRIVGAAGGPIPDLVPLAALASFGWMAAVVMNVRVVHQLAFGGLLGVWALAVLGWGARRTVIALGATFLLGLPIWGALAPPLQRATTLASGAATRLAGITAEIGYNHISIASGTFLVEEGCAGINYLMGGLVLGAFYAHLFVDRWQTQLKVVALAGGVSIVGNWIRVAVLIFIGEATAMQSPMIEDHLWQGWVIFTLLMIPTYFLAEKIERRDRRRFPSTRAAPDSEPEEKHPPAAGRLRMAVLATLAVAAGPVVYTAFGLVPRGPITDRSADVFELVDAWVPQEVPAASVEWTPHYQGVDERVAWVVRGDDGSVDAARHYFVDQRQGEELIQFENAMAPDSLTASDRVVGPVGPRRRFVREAVILDGDVARVVWYWYRVAGFETPFPTKAKLLETVAFLRRFPAAELVTLSAACGADSCLEAVRAISAAVGGPRVDPPDSVSVPDEPAAPDAGPGEPQP